MPQAPIPTWEAARLSALERLRIFGTPAEERFDRITRLARKTFNVPIAMIDLLGSESVWIKSAQGYDQVNAPRCYSYCSYTVLEPQALLIQDASQDPRLFDNPYAHNLKFYAGVPLRSEGMPVGALCVCGFESRAFTQDELETLQDLAGMAESELKVSMLSETQLQLAAENERLTHRALVDDLTKVWNRGAVMEVLGKELRKALDTEGSTGVLLLDVDHFKVVNDTYGHQVGDHVLREVAERMRATLRPADSVGRFGGEEFLVILPGCSKADILDVAERLLVTVSYAPFESDGHKVPVTVSIGATMAFEGAQSEDLLVKAADLALYRAKQSGRNRVEPRWVTPSFMRLRSIKP